MNSAVRPLPSRWTRAALAAVIGMSAALPLAAVAAEVKHAQGVTEVAANPKKVIVLDLASLDTLDALGVPVAGAPTTPVPARLKKYVANESVQVGTLFEPNYEVIFATDPDVIIVGGRSQPKFGELAKIAPTIDMTVDTKDLVGSVTRNTNTLATLFGKEKEGEQKLQALQQSIASLKEKSAGAGTALIVLTTGGKMSAYGPGSRFGVLHDAFGFAAADAKLNTSNHGQAVSYEFITKTNPDWLFVIDRDAAIGREGASAKQMLDNELVRTTNAWKKQQVVYLDGMEWYLLGSAGLGALQENVNQLTRALDGAKQ